MVVHRTSLRQTASADTDRRSHRVCIFCELGGGAFRRRIPSCVTRFSLLAAAKALKLRHIAHEAQIYPGRHDWQYFAEHLPDSLEFESRAFGK